MILKRSDANKDIPIIYELKVGELVSIKAPAHAGLPRNGRAVVEGKPAQGFYDIAVVEGKRYCDVPHYYLRPDNILIHGEVVKMKSLREVLTSDMYRMPTYQRRYAWEES